jgi:hypothetical protein
MKDYKKPTIEVLLPNPEVVEESYLQYEEEI